MNSKLQACSQIAEIIGSLAIVVSLIFVGIQIKQNNAIARTEAYQRNIDALNEWRALLLTTGHAEEMRNFISGNDIKKGSESDIIFLQTMGLTLFDRAYFSYRNGIMDEAGWNRFDSQLCPAWNNSLRITNTFNFLSQDFIDFSSQKCGFEAKK